MLVLRTCDAAMQSYGGFTWPASGLVEAPDWNPIAECGQGLHGWLYGEGDGSLGNWDETAIWLVVEVEEGTVVDLLGKVKFPCGVVAFVGTRFEATNYLLANGGAGRAVIGSTLTGGDGSTLTGGYRSTLTGGNCSTLTGGYRSTLTGGYGSTLTGGDGSTLTGGDGSTLTGGDGSTLTGGNRSTLTGGDGSTLTGGYRSTLQVRRFDGVRHRISTGYIGENGLLASVPYRLDEKGQFSEVTSIRCTPENEGA